MKTQMERFLDAGRDLEKALAAEGRFFDSTIVGALVAQVDANDRAYGEPRGDRAGAKAPGRRGRPPGPASAEASPPPSAEEAPVETPVDGAVTS